MTNLSTAYNIWDLRERAQRRLPRASSSSPSNHVMPAAPVGAMMTGILRGLPNNSTD